MSSILIRNGCIFTMDERRRYLPHGAVLVEGSRIVDVGETDRIRKEHSADIVIDASNKIVMPGLINGHDHYEQTFMKGLLRTYTERTPQWVKEFKIPLTKEMRAEDYYYSNMIACLEMIRSGITCGVNSICQQDPKKVRAFGLDKSVQAVEESGVRTLIPVSAADRFEPSEFLLSPDEAVDLVDWAITRWNGKAEDRIRVCTSVAGVFSTTPNLWRAMKNLAEERGVILHTHVASATTGEVEEAYVNNNLGPMITGAHCVWLSERDIEIIAKTGMKAVHCPTYKLSYSIDSKVDKFGDAIAPIADMLRKGITVGLGTDGCMGDTHDMFREMRNLAFTQQYKMQDKTLFPPTKLLEMTTVDCARTLSWQDQIGSLEPGKRADIVIIDPNHPNMIPWTNPAACLVYLASGSDVETVIIDGKIVMENRMIQTVKEKEVFQRAQSAAEDLIKRAGLEHLMSRGLDPWCSNYKL